MVQTSRSIVESDLRTVRLERSGAENCRRNAVELRSLMEPDERIGIEPVPTRAVPPVDDRDVDIGVIDERTVKAIPMAPAPTTR